MKKQVIIIHGGETFETYEKYVEYLNGYELKEEKLHPIKKWKDLLPETLGDEYEIIAPEMPCYRNSKYAEWKIWFEKFIPYFDDEIILVGHSLGGIFIPKYLAENTLPKKIKAAFLVAPCFGDTDGYKLGDFNFKDDEDFSNLIAQTDYVSIYHSADDELVPASEFENYIEKLPNAHAHKMEGYGHFNTVEFPEIVEEIKGL